MPGSVKGDVSAVEPVIYKGVRYETIEKPALRDLDPSSGFIIAFDESAGTEKWVLKVYGSDMPEDIEDHKRNVSISQIRLKGIFSKKLLVVNERGARFEVDLDSQEVTKA
jgi:hypothetical protein